MRKGVGNQTLLLATIKDKDLANPTKFIFLGYKLASALDLSPIRYDTQHYPTKTKGTPDGWTITIYLSESHVCFETYPEFGTYDLEIASCKRINVEQFITALTSFGMTKKEIKSAQALQKQGWTWKEK